MHPLQAVAIDLLSGNGARHLTGNLLQAVAHESLQSRLNCGANCGAERGWNV